MGLYTPTILSKNSYLNWFYDRGAIKDRAHTGTSKGQSQAINRGPIRKFQPKFANVYVTIQSHGFSAGVRTHYVTANRVRDGPGGGGGEGDIGELGAWEVWVNLWLVCVYILCVCDCSSFHVEFQCP